jgi:hypothetical protein
MADILDPLRSRGADGHRLAAVVEDFLAGRPLAKAWGAAQPDRAASMRLARDNALRALAAQEPGSIATRVRAVRQLVRRYESSRWWRVDRHRSAIPPDYVGTIDEQLYIAVASGCAVPMSRTQLHKILSVRPGSIVSGRAEAENARVFVREGSRDAGDGDAAGR